MFRLVARNLCAGNGSTVLVIGGGSRGNVTINATSIVLLNVTDPANPAVIQQLGVPAARVRAIQPLDDCGSFSAASQGSFIIATTAENTTTPFNAIRRYALILDVTEMLVRPQSASMLCR